MRDLATQVITELAVSIGLPKAAVFQELADEAKEKIMLPARRMELQILDEALQKQGWRVGQSRTVIDGKSVSTMRWARYRTVLSVRVVIRDSSQQWLDEFGRQFLEKIPFKVRDTAGNWTRIEATKATRKGYTFASIRIEETPVLALHIAFSGIVYKDVETGMIEKITLYPSFKA